MFPKFIHLIDLDYDYGNCPLPKNGINERNERERERESTTNGMEECDPIIEKELQETLLFIRARMELVSN